MLHRYSLAKVLLFKLVNVGHIIGKEKNKNGEKCEHFEKNNSSKALVTLNFKKFGESDKFSDLESRLGTSKYWYWLI